MDREVIKAYVFADVKDDAVCAAADLGLTLSAWVQMIEAIREHQVRQARAAAIASYGGKAAL